MTYAWQMTGDPWLDGAIYARGGRDNAHSASMSFYSISAPVQEVILEHIAAAGLEMDISEYPAFGRMQLRVTMTSQQDIFDDLSLKFRERILINGLHSDFIAGYLSTCWVPYKDGSCGIATKRLVGSIDDVLRYLLEFDVHEYDYVKDNGTIVLSKKAVEGSHFFQNLRDTYEEFLAEPDQEEEPDAPTRMDLQELAQRIERLCDLLQRQVLRRLGEEVQILGSESAKDVIAHRVVTGLDIDHGRLRNLIATYDAALEAATSEQMIACRQALRDLVAGKHVDERLLQDIHYAWPKLIEQTNRGKRHRQYAVPAAVRRIIEKDGLWRELHPWRAWSKALLPVKDEATILVDCPNCHTTNVPGDVCECGIGACLACLIGPCTHLQQVMNQ